MDSTNKAAESCQQAHCRDDWNTIKSPGHQRNDWCLHQCKRLLQGDLLLLLDGRRDIHFMLEDIDVPFLLDGDLSLLLVV